MKRIFILALLLAAFAGKAQNVGINGTGAAPNAAAMLDVSATNKGVLVPRVALTSINDVVTVPSPVTSLLVYNTTASGTSPTNVVPGYYLWNGTVWERLVSSNYLNSTSISAIGKFYSTLSWSGTWLNNSVLSFVITDPNMICNAANASVAFVSFDCTNSNAIMAGFTIRSVKCNNGNFVVTVLNGTGSNFSAGGIPITYAAFY